MSKEVLVFLHVKDESAGYIETFLLANKIPHRIIKSHLDEPIPQLDDSIAGLVFMGGLMSVNDDIPWLKEEMRLIKQAMDVGVPILGHCLGGQLISKVCGQSVTKNPVAEVGWFRCQSKGNAVAKEWLGDLDDFQMFHWHSETFTIPYDMGATHIFSSPYCDNQAYVIGDNILAMQCHVEMTEDEVRAWLKAAATMQLNVNDSEQSIEQMASDLSVKVAEINQVAERLYSRWAQTLVL